MGKVPVFVCDKEVLEYNFDLFTENQIGEILLKTMNLGATAASKKSIVLCNFEQLSKLNDLIVSYLT